MADSKQRPFSIRIFVPDGNPDSLRLIEKSNWTGVGLVFNRTNYKQAVQRPEFDKTGVYVLVGSSEESALPTIYVGEGDAIKERLNQHYSSKDFWDWAVFFVTKDNSLNKAHVKYLESRLLDLANAAKQCRLDNGKPSLRPVLSESESADVESFLLDMLSVFPLLGLRVFEKIESPSNPSNLFYIQRKGIKATGYEDTRGFVVRKGSQATKEEAPSIHRYLTTLRKDFLEQGVLVSLGPESVFVQDQVFTSPSTAAAVVLGRNANGRTEWKTQEGKTLKQLQSSAAGHGVTDV